MEARFSPVGRLAHARVTPRMPFSLIRRATRLRDVDTPLALSLMKTLGAP